MGDGVSGGIWDLDFEALTGATPFHEVEMRCSETIVMRLTDRVPEVGETIKCRGLLWDVVRVERDPTVSEAVRFVCDLAVSRRVRL